MPRLARQKAKSGIYHIMLRGSNRATIFEDDEDCDKFLDVMRHAKRASGFRLFAWCLMGNHVHLLMQEGNEPLERTFRRIGASYVYYFHHKYDMIGHLFQDRFRSEPIEDDANFLDVLRYICQNPVKAGLSKDPLDYEWLGCSGVTNPSALLDPSEPYTDLEGEALRKFVSQPCDGIHLDTSDEKRLTDREAARLLVEASGCSHARQLAELPEEVRGEWICKAAEMGISIRQLARITGISKGIIERERQRM